MDSEFETAFERPPLKVIDNNVKRPAPKKGAIEQIYQKKSQLEHILLRPDSYIGSVEMETKPMWVWDIEDGADKMNFREISYVPGLYKIFDEILVNAFKHKQRDKSMNCIEIDIDVDSNEIIIYNNGKGIPVVEHKDEKLYEPTMIFGHLPTSSNYDDNEKKVVGGAKLCNIFSTRFKVETSNKESRKAFAQVWTDNMKNAKDPKISSNASEDFTRVTFQPDLAKFKMDKLDKDILALFSRRVFDVAGSSKGVNVYLNKKKLTVRVLKKLSKNCHAKKNSKLTGIPKLEEATDAGTKNSMGCTLILTEGDSAKSMVVAGLGVVGRAKYGVLPLQFTVVNVRDATQKQIQKNTPVNQIIRTLGLEYGKKYESNDDLKTLRYGKLLIMTDQDVDGSHVKGLLINFIHHNWPSLLKLDFLEEFITPIVKATKGNDVHSFYSLPEFEEWKKGVPDWRKYKIKYYKGLGAHTSIEAKEYFTRMERHRIRFVYTGAEDDDCIEMAFSKKMVDERKDWLTNSLEERKRRRQLGLPEMYLYETNTRNVSYTDFVNKELVLFSIIDNERSIPSLVDGLKPGQRKVIYTCFKRNDKREVKLAQLAGSVGEHSAYHHGEVSLMATIINLAHDFVGSNNINLLMPNGQFGTRLQGGKDAACPRYIFTMLNPLARKLFCQLDEPLLNYLYDDNLKIEPEYYVPIIPTVLVNGSKGIGTGWHTKIPNYDPREIIENIRRKKRGEKLKPMKPWYKGFRGTIEQIDTQHFVTNGEAAILSPTSFEITELPVKTWTQKYKESTMETLRNGTERSPPLINDYKEYHTDTTVRFVVSMTEANLKKSIDGLHKTFKIQSSISTTSMFLFDADGCIKQYQTPEEILLDFYPIRLDFYVKRKAYYEGILEAEALKLENQARFILEKNDGIIIMKNIKRANFIAQLIERNYDSDPVEEWKKKDEAARKNAHHEEAKAEEDEETEAADDDKVETTGGHDFEYLLSTPSTSYLSEGIQDLKEQRDRNKAELEKLRKMTPEDLWEDALVDLLAELDAQEKREREEADGTSAKAIKAAKSAKAKAPLRLGKVKDNGVSVEETKPAKGAERIEPTFNAEAILKEYENTARIMERIRDNTKRASDASDSGAQLAGPSGLAPKKVAVAKPKPKAKEVAEKRKSSDYSDDDDSVRVVKKPTKKAKKAIASDSEASMSDFNDDDSSKAKGSSPIAKQRNFRDRKKVNYKPVPITSRESEPESEESLSYATIDEDELDDLYAPSPHQRQLTEQIKEQIRTYAVVHQWNSKKIHQILERNFGDKACCYHTVLRYAKQFREGTNTTKPKDAKVKKETKKKKTATATAAPKAKKTKAGGGQMQPNATVPDNVSPYFANDLDQYESMNEDEAETAYLVARANDHYD